MAEAWIRENRPITETPQAAPGASEDMSSHSPDAWREAFNRWRAENCAHRECRDDWGGIGCLWVAFCEWTVKHDSVHCERRTFERLLADEGYRCVEGMVASLVLRVDLDAALRAHGMGSGGGLRRYDAVAGYTSQQ
jgi:hypothetical protein